MNLVQVAVAHAKAKALLKAGNYVGAVGAWQEAVAAQPPPHLRTAIDGCLAKLVETVLTDEAGEGEGIEGIVENAVRLISEPEQRRSAADAYARNAAACLRTLRERTEEAGGQVSREDCAAAERAIARLNVAAQLGSAAAAREVEVAAAFGRKLAAGVVPEEALDHFERGQVELAKSPPNLAGAVHHLRQAYVDGGAEPGRVAEVYARALTLWAQVRTRQIQGRYDYLQNPAEIEQAVGKVEKILEDVRLAVRLGNPDAPGAEAEAVGWLERLRELLKSRTADAMPASERAPETVKIGRQTTLRLRERVSAEEGARLFEQAHNFLAQDPPDTARARAALDRMRLGLGPDFPARARDMLGQLVSRDARLGWRAVVDRMAAKKGERVTAQDVELMNQAVEDMGLANALGCGEMRDQLPMARQLLTQVRLAAENGWLIEWDARVMLDDLSPPPGQPEGRGRTPRRTSAWVVAVGVLILLAWVVLGVMLWLRGLG
ncbi:MAG: hypothetical protein BWZ02_00754 [Lentisphaerae bacterium ADurb.BinA184]|nr:MAG: hypothetical protein BWZ02_00754 [Lentisphaerae bacterium ADurb.BinA184]